MSAPITERLIQLGRRPVGPSTAPGMDEMCSEYGVDVARYGPPAPPTGHRDEAIPGHHEPPDPRYAATVAQPVKDDNELYIRDYAKCVLCYKCVEACGV